MYLVNRTIDRTVRTVRILWTANSPNSSHSANSSNNEQCEQLILCEQCERRTVRTVRSVRTVRTTNSANSSYYANGANSEQCEQFTLGEQCERRTVRTVRFFEIVEHGEQCEQVRTLFGGPCRKWPIIVESDRRLFFHGRSAIFDSDRIKVRGTLGCTESGSPESNAKLNLPSGFGLSNFIVFNSISRVYWSNQSSKGRKISCGKHV